MNLANLSTAKRFYQIVANHGDLSDILSHDCLWEIIPGFPYSRDYLGLEEIAFFFESLTKHFDFREAEAIEFMDAGRDVIVTGNYRTKATESGESTELRFAHIWTVEGNYLTRLRHFADTVKLSKILGHNVPTISKPSRLSLQ